MKYLSILSLFLSISSFAEDYGPYVINPERVEFWDLEFKIPNTPITYLPTHFMVRLYNKNGSEIDGDSPHLMASYGKKIKNQCLAVQKQALAYGKKMKITLHTMDSPNTWSGEEDGHCEVSNLDRSDD